MAAKEIRFGEDARARMVKGVNILANAVNVAERLAVRVDQFGLLLVNLDACSL